MSPQDTLKQLAPVRRERVYDLLQAVGMNVSGWANYKKGAKAPAANPKYCYEWSFTQGDEYVVLNLWHASLRPDGDTLSCQLNMRAVASDIERAQDDKWREKRPKPIWAKRARAMDLALQRAARSSTPIRVVVCEGTMRDHAAGDEKSSEVQRRLLDPIAWRLDSYDWTTGEARLRRGSPIAGSTPAESWATSPAASLYPESAASAPAAMDALTAPDNTRAEGTNAPGTAEESTFIDQFDARAEAPRTLDVTSTVYVRDANVRKAALKRAGGLCQLCSQPGFRTPSGKIYLETHHVVPLSAGGLDILTNVVALCATDHRRAHFDAEHQALTSTLLAIAAEASGTGSSVPA